MELLKAPGFGVEGDVQRLDGRLMFLASAEVPKKRDPDRPAGTITLGRYIDQRVVENIAGNFAPVEASLIVDDRTVASTLPRPVQGRDLVPDELEPLLAAGQTVKARQSFGNRSFFTALTPIRDVATEEQQGILALFHPRLGDRR